MELGRHFVAHDTSPSNQAMRDELRDAVMEGVAALSPRDREVLLMRHIEQLGTAEIAETLGMAEAGVKARLFRALNRLRTKLEAQGMAVPDFAKVGQAFQPDVGLESPTYDADDLPPGDDDAVLAELTEKISRRLESGEPVNGGDLGDDPETAGPIRQLLPALRTMVSLGKQVAREEGLRTRLQTKRKGTLSSFLDTNPEAEEVGP